MYVSHLSALHAILQFHYVIKKRNRDTIIMSNDLIQH